MKKYRYYPEFDENDCLVWYVFENATQQIIESFLFEEDALDETLRLESGSAFDGFTPSFVLKEVALQKTQKEINTNFEQLLR